jgi:gluconolactonase
MAQEFEVIAEGLAFPEGPVVMPDGSVIVCEIESARLTRVWGGGRSEVVSEIGGGPNGAQLGPDGALYVCNNGGPGPDGGHGGNGRIERVDIATGKVERLYDSVDGQRLNAPNDLVFDRQGGIWFTDFGAVTARTIAKSGLYYCLADGGRIHEGYFGGLSYNGVGLSPDEKVVYVASTFPGSLHRFQIEAPGKLMKTGEQGPLDQLAGRVPSTPGFRNYVGRGPEEGWFDSLAVTAAGNVCIGTIWQGGVTTVSPAGESSFVPLPDLFVTNIAFGGEDMRDAYVTCSETGRLLKVRWSEPGLRLNFS